MKITLSFAALALLLISAQAQASVSTDAIEKATGGYVSESGGIRVWVAPSTRTKTPDGGTVTTVRDTSTRKDVTVTRDAKGNVTNVQTQSSSSGTGSAKLDEACVKYLLNSGKATATAFKVCGAGGKLNGKISEDGEYTGGGSDMSEREKERDGLGSHGTEASADKGFNDIDPAAFGGGSPTDPNHNTHESIGETVSEAVDAFGDQLSEIGESISDGVADALDTEPGDDAHDQSGSNTSQDSDSKDTGNSGGHGM